MPTKVRVSRLIWSLFSSPPSRPYICSSCIQKRAIWTAIHQTKAPREFHFRSRPTPQKRHASSITPVTAVNVTKAIPENNRQLYEELTVLQKEAANFVNLSQLKLILRGLESDDPVIRVAVLGVNGSQGPKKLVKALLADPLESKQPWEERLEDGEDTRALLIRFGEEYRYDQRHPLLNTMSIPALTLKSHKVEIVVNTLYNGQKGSNVTEDLESINLLVPALDIASSASGRVSMITYPVHKTLVYGENMQGILAIPRIIASRGSEDPRKLIQGAANVQWQLLDSEASSNQPITLINLPQAERAITSFRKSLNNYFDYEHGWIASNLPLISTFILSSTSPTKAMALNPALKSLILFALEEATSAISLAQSSGVALATSSTVPDATRTMLREALTRWAEAAHRELQEQLGLAFDSRAWYKLAWWKLLWRVDDVGSISADLLQRSFLVEAEKEIIWIGGRIQQACGSPTLEVNLNSTQKEHKLGAEPPAPQLRDVLPPPSSEQDSRLQIDTANPRPQEIGLVRARLLLSVPALQALAQKLVLQSLSTTVLTSTLSTLLYISVSTTSVYEAGTIGVLGFVWSARRLQRIWERAREAWVGMVKEEGRKVLGTVEGTCGNTIQVGGRVVRDEAAENEERGAREAVQRVTEVLTQY